MKEIEITDWKNIVDVFDKYLDQNEQIFSRFFFRGQSDKSWELFSSLARLVNGDEISEKKAKYYESQSLQEFKSLYHLTNEKLAYRNETSEIDIYIDMQHYSCPTRLLDWTNSPFVALYFAISEKYNTDCSVFVWDYLMYQASVKREYPNYKNLDYAQLIDFKEFDHVQIATPKKRNERVYKQQGAFSISNNILKPHCEIIEKLDKMTPNDSSLTKLIISYEKKLEFLDRLKYMNITASSLFPGLDGIGKEIKETLLLRKWKKK